jgi:hypothetical protein
MNIDLLTSDFNSDSSIGTERELSLGTANAADNQHGGSFMDIFSFGDKKNKNNSNNNASNDAKILQACNEKNMAVVEFMIMNEMVNDLCAKDSNGNTLLNHLAKNYNMLPNKERVINKILSRSDVASFINKGNNNGDTPLITATRGKEYDLCKKLVEKKADKNIANKFNERVESATVSASPNKTDNFSDMGPLTDTPSTMKAPSGLASVFNMAQEQNGMNGMTDMNEMNGTEMMGGSMTNNINNLINGLFNKRKDSSFTEGSMSMGTLNSETQRGGYGSDSVATPANSDDFINMLVNTYITKNGTEQQGGKRKGKRHVNTTKKTSRKTSHKNTDNSEESLNRYQNELSRIIKSQTSVIHDRVEKKIMELMNVDLNTAKDYKSILWSRIKEKMADSPGIDKAIELEKMATKENLEAITKKELSERSESIKQHLSEKEKNKSERSKNSNKSSELSSSDTLTLSETEDQPKKRGKKKSTKSEGAFSPTSIDTSISFSD